MSKKYSREETIETIKNAIETAMKNDIATIYNDKCINWKGKTNDKNAELYSEIIAKELLRNKIVELFSKIPIISRENYRVEHDGETENQTNRKEEMFAKKLFTDYKSGNGLNKIGRIINYQVPLKKIQNDVAGKIDLVSYNKNKSEEIAYLIELKHKANEETLLRCVLEIATYYQLLNKDNFKESYPELKNSDIKKGILVFKDSSQHNEIKEIQDPSYLKALIYLLEVKIFVIDDSMDVEHIPLCN